MTDTDNERNWQGSFEEFKDSFSAIKTWKDRYERNHVLDYHDLEDDIDIRNDRKPVAWAFEFRPKIEDADWHKKVEFSDPRESWCTYGDMEVRNIQPLYTEIDRGQTDE